MVNTIQEYLKTRKPTVEDCALASVNTADGIRYVMRYESDSFESTKNLITFFIPDEDTDIDDLLRYKQKTDTKLLISVNAYGRGIHFNDLADVVVDCWYSEAYKVMDFMTNTIRGDGFIGVDFNDLVTILAHKPKPIVFLQTSKHGDDYYNLAITEMLDEYNNDVEDKNLTGLLVTITADLSFEASDLKVISRRVNDFFAIDASNIFYQVTFDDSISHSINGKSCEVGFFVVNG